MSNVRSQLTVSLWRGGEDGRYERYSVPLGENQTVLDVVTWVQRNLDSLLEVTVSGRRIQVVADAAVAPGGCIIESVVGVIDARLETQLKCLEEILLRVAVRR